MAETLLSPAKFPTRISVVAHTNQRHVGDRILKNLSQTKKAIA